MDKKLSDSVEDISNSEMQVFKEWENVGLPLDDCHRIVTEDKIKWEISSTNPWYVCYNCIGKTCMRYTPTAALKVIEPIDL